MVTWKKAKRNAWQNQSEKTHRPLLSMLTADLRHFVPNRTSLQITTFSFCSNQLPEELIDPKVFQIRSFSIAFWPMRFDSCQPSWSNGMARRSDDKTWGRQTWYDGKNAANQAYLDLHQSRTMTFFCGRGTPILIIIIIVYDSIYSIVVLERHEGNNMKI